MDAWRQKIIDEAMTWERTPWHHHARVKGVGVDCAQYLIAVFSAVGLIEEFDPGAYPPDWMLHRSDEKFLEWLGKYGHPVTTPEPGDVAIWRFGRTFSHAAIVTEWPKVIHAFRPHRAVVQGNATLGELSGRKALLYSVIP